ASRRHPRCRRQRAAVTTEVGTMSDLDRPSPDPTLPMPRPPGPPPATAAHPASATAPGHAPPGDPDGPRAAASPRRRGRDVLLVLTGVVAGLAIALVVVALMTGDAREADAATEARI